MELKVEKLLKEKSVAYRLIPLREKAYTVVDVIKFSQTTISPEEICKTIIIKGRKTGMKIAVLVRGNDRLNFSKAKKIFGEEMCIGSEEDVLKSAGVEPGAVCPFLLSVPLCVDSRVIELKQINCGSGDHLQGLEFNTENLKTIASYRVIDIAK